MVYLTNSKSISKFVVVMLTFVLILRFLSADVIRFYVFFELSILPTRVMVLCWGNQPERIQATVYFFLYTLVGSFPFLGRIIYLRSTLNEVKFFTIFFSNILRKKYVSKLIQFFFFFVFLIKLPLYGVHLWLPKAHVEASVVGSMILASVLLKLGGYGLVRLKICKRRIIQKYLIFWAFITLFLVGMIAFRCKDVKMVIAYSSIIHMGLIVLLFVIPKKISIFYGILIMISHGFIRRGLFQKFKKIYQMSKSRKILIKKGVQKVSSIVMFFFFFLVCLKRSVPLRLSFIAEIKFSFIIYGLSRILLTFFFLSLFLSGLFKIKLYLQIKKGYKKNACKRFYKKNACKRFYSFVHCTSYLFIFVLNSI